ncbi:hypothetical protein, partial [Novipirellula sp.]|uniref:hypothetical protein n=1 Tax=Novipirellula sp. TaxID=2795430 RepID=UPI0035639635
MKLSVSTDEKLSLVPVCPAVSCAVKLAVPVWLICDMVETLDADEFSDAGDSRSGGRLYDLAARVGESNLFWGAELASNHSIRLVLAVQDYIL